MIDLLRDTITQHAPLALALGGLIVGLAFGAVVFATNFCAMGSLADIHNFGDTRRFRAWVLAAAAALAGTLALQAAGIVDLGMSMYLAGTSLNWVGHIVGGLMLGFGMVFAGGCPSRNLVRAGSGDLRALLTLVVLGLFAYIAIGGLFGPVRAAIEQATSVALASPTQSLGDLVSSATGIGARMAALALTALLGAGALAYCFADARFRTSPVHIFSGLAIGTIIVAGWALTGLAFDEMAAKPAAPISLTYVRPAGDALQWLTLYTATPMPGFGTASVFGALIGALLAALVMGRFRISTYSDTADTLRSLGGAALMGIGGVMALGCTIGQAVTGLSTLALGSFLTFASIIAGGFWGLRVLERQIMASA